MKGQTPVGKKRHLVYVQGPTAPVPDGDGGYTEGWGFLVPSTWYCSIEPATTRDLERVASGTVISTASHVIKGRYHPQITVSTRLVYRGVVYQATGVSDPELRHIETIVLAVELIGAIPAIDLNLSQLGLMQDGLAQEGFA